MSRSKPLFTLILSALLLIAFADLALAQTKLRFAHTVNTEDSMHLAVVEFAKKVGEKTGGAIRVEVFPAGQLGNDSQILDGAKLGAIDLAMTGNPFFSSFAPEMNVLDLPFLFRDYYQAYKVVDGPIGEQLLKTVERSGLKGLGSLEIGFRNLTNSKRPVKVPEDVKGLKIRTTPNPAHLQAFRLLGANPVGMPFTEVYLALKTGTVDGQENPTTVIYTAKFYEVQKYMSFTRHAYTAANVVMNLKKYQELKPEYQKAFHEAMRETVSWQRNFNRNVEVQALKNMTAAGLQIEEKPDREAFRKIVAESAAEEYAKRFGRETLTQILNVR
jgi:tripartite ATP-independent transporter DctP family solute receptor